MSRLVRLTAVLTLALALTTACAPRYRIMQRTEGTAFPGAVGRASEYEASRARWTRTEALGVRGSAEVTMIDPELGADEIAWRARQDGREVTEGYDKELWEVYYGPRGDRMPFEVRWRFDKLYQPQRTSNPKVGWTFTLMDDHGRQWQPLDIGEVEQDSDSEAWTGSFRVWFPIRDLHKGPLFDGRTGTVTLRISGAPGWADFVWKFRPAVGAQAED